MTNVSRDETQFSCEYRRAIKRMNCEAVMGGMYLADTECVEELAYPGYRLMLSAGSAEPCK